MLMNNDAHQQQFDRVSRQLQQSEKSLQDTGIHLLNSVLFSTDRNYYQVLGLRPDASIEAIRSRYRYLIPLFHPDKCYTADVNCDVISAQINQAYNTLKKNDSRLAYDDSIIIGANYSATTRSEPWEQRTADQYQPVRKQQKASLLGIFFQWPLLQRYPKTAVWGLFIVILASMIVISGRDESRLLPEIRHASKPPIKIHETAQQVVSKKDGSGDDEQLPADYVQQSIQSARLVQLLEGSNNHDSSAGENQPGLPDKTAVAIDSSKVPADAKPKSDVSASKQALSFDGGPPAQSTEVNKLLSRAAYTDRGYLLAVQHANPELIMMRFVHGYESGDITEISRLFVNNVRTNHGWGRQQMIDRFSNLFSTTSSRKIHIKQLKVEPQNQREALIISDIEASVLHENETSLRHYNGEIIFRLVNNDSGMQIAEMLHNVH
jgi:hypothetical protein